MSLAGHDPDFDPATDLTRWLQLCCICSIDQILKEKIQSKNNQKQNTIVYQDVQEVTMT